MQARVKGLEVRVERLREEDVSAMNVLPSLEDLDRCIDESIEENPSKKQKVQPLRKCFTIAEDRELSRLVGLHGPVSSLWLILCSYFNVFSHLALGCDCCRNEN